MSRKNITNSIRTLSGIDALYYQLKIKIEDYTYFYHNTLLKSVLDNHPSLTRTSQSFKTQYVNYELLSDKKDLPEKIATIRFKNLCDKDGLESIAIQHNTTYMNIVGYEESYYQIVEFINFLGLEVHGSKIQRIDLNAYVFNVNLDFLKHEYFSTLLKRSSQTYTEHWNHIGHNIVNYETFTLGTRTGKSVYMRIYNKKAELEAKDKDKVKESMICYRYLMKYNEEIDLLKDVFYNVEFELKREVLRSYDVDSVEDTLTKAGAIMNDIMVKRIRMLKKPRRLDDKNQQRADTHPIWNEILRQYLNDDQNYDITRIKKKKYTKDKEWLLGRVLEFTKDNTYVTSELLVEIAQILNQKEL